MRIQRAQEGCGALTHGHLGAMTAMTQPRWPSWCQPSVLWSWPFLAMYVVLAVCCLASPARAVDKDTFYLDEWTPAEVMPGAWTQLLPGTDVALLRPNAAYRQVPCCSRFGCRLCTVLQQCHLDWEACSQSVDGGRGRWLRVAMTHSSHTHGARLPRWLWLFNGVWKGTPSRGTA